MMKHFSAWACMATTAMALSACGGGGGSGSNAPVEPTAVVELRASADRYQVEWNAATSLSVISNDAAVNTMPTLTISEAPSHGNALVDGTAVRYTPTPGYFGPDGFKYTVAGGGQSAEASVDVTVSAKFQISGVVADAPLPSAVVNVMSSSSATPLATAQTDAQGAYVATVETADPAAFLSLKATGSGAQAKVVLTSLLGDAATVAKALPSGGTTLTPQELPAARISHVTTALSALAQQKNGALPTSSAALSELVPQVSAGDLSAYAAAIQLVADKSVALPSDVANTYELVANASVVTEFLKDQIRTQNTRYTEVLKTVITDGAPLSVPAAGQADVVHVVVPGQGLATGHIAYQAVEIPIDAAPDLSDDLV